LFPTICGLAGITPRNALPGEDASTLARGQREQLERDGVLLEFVLETRSGMPFHNQAWRGFRSRRYKYTVHGGNEGMQPWQFFDLQQDPYELQNLIDDSSYEAIIREHHQWLRERMSETGDHAWLAAAFGVEPLNEWIPCEIGG
jgi:arylsulfatase A-like enzyme